MFSVVHGSMSVLAQENVTASQFMPELFDTEKYLDGQVTEVLTWFNSKFVLEKIYLYHLVFGIDNRFVQNILLQAYSFQICDFSTVTRNEKNLEVYHNLNFSLKGFYIFIYSYKYNLNFESNFYLTIFCIKNASSGHSWKIKR